MTFLTQTLRVGTWGWLWVTAGGSVSSGTARWGVWNTKEGAESTPMPCSRDKINPETQMPLLSLEVCGKGLGLWLLHIHGKRLSPPQVPETPTASNPTLVLGNPGGTAEWIMESSSICSAQTPQFKPSQPQLITKSLLGTHTFCSAPFAVRGTGGWQSPSALGGKDTSPATSWHKWTVWKRKSKWGSF